MWKEWYEKKIKSNPNKSYNYEVHEAKKQNKTKQKTNKTKQKTKKCLSKNLILWIIVPKLEIKWPLCNFLQF